jgi:hypothetical protein
MVGFYRCVLPFPVHNINASRTQCLFFLLLHILTFVSRIQCVFQNILNRSLNGATVVAANKDEWAEARMQICSRDTAASCLSSCEIKGGKKKIKIHKNGKGERNLDPRAMQKFGAKKRFDISIKQGRTLTRATSFFLMQISSLCTSLPTRVLYFQI